MLHVKQTHDHLDHLDHLAASSGLTRDGRLFVPVRPDSSDRSDSDAVVGFRRVRRRQLRGQRRISWDGSPIQTGPPITDRLQRGAAQRLQLERWPGDAPDLNAEEGVRKASGTSASGGR